MERFPFESTRDVVGEHFEARRRLADEQCLAMQQLFNELRCLALSDADCFLAAVKATMGDTGFPLFDELLSHLNPSVGGGYGTKETRQRLADTWYAALEKANRKMWEEHMPSLPPLALVDTIFTLMPNELPASFVNAVTRCFNDSKKVMVDKGKTTTTTPIKEKKAVEGKGKDKSEDKDKAEDKGKAEDKVDITWDKVDMTWDQVTWPVDAPCNCESCDIEPYCVEASRDKASRDKAEVDRLIEAVESARQDQVRAKKQLSKAKKVWKQTKKEHITCSLYMLGQPSLDLACRRRDEAFNVVKKASQAVTRAKEVKKEAKKQLSICQLEKLKPQ